MILSCNFEELTALTRGAHSYLAETAGEEPSGVPGVVAVPVTLPSIGDVREAVADVARQLEGEVSFSTLGEQMQAERGVEAIVEQLHSEMTEAILDLHPASEDAVAAYFDYAHALSVLGRLRELGLEMRSILEVVAGRDPGPEALHSFHFPD